MKYTIGLDYGTLSVRALLVEVDTGKEVASSTYEYSDSVIDNVLPSSGEKLPPDWALQNPADYLTGLEKTIKEVIDISHIDPYDIIGIGVDFTACTVLPITKDGNAMCMSEEWKNNPHAWVKLWKHHAAQPEANKINETAYERNEEWIKRYGGKISSEWLFSKIIQVLDEAPEVYNSCYKFIEATDWIILQMTGNECRNATCAGYKALWSKADGYPSKDYFKALDPRLENVVSEKLSEDIYPIGDRAGSLIKYWADKTGLKEGIAVAVGNVDAHAAIPAITITGEGVMGAIMGTSGCYMVLGKEPKLVEGICGYTADGILPGFIGFEAGQGCVGDLLAWFVDTLVPEEYAIEAKKEGISVHQLLTEKAKELRPGESGILALDWWNGNRCILVDGDLSGLIIGLTISTKPEEIYRALIEAIAFGCNIIIESFRAGGVAVEEVVACGGIAEKNPMFMQILSDVTNLEWKIAQSAQSCALGAAMWGAVAAGSLDGGYDNISDAVRKMAGVRDVSYKPTAKYRNTYNILFNEYRKLHDYFGRGENNVMKILKNMKININ